MTGCTAVDTPLLGCKTLIPLDRDLISSLPTRPIPYAVLGQPIAHSLSPQMQQAAFDALGREACYLRIETGVDTLPATIAAMRRVPFGGWNCTLPLKEAMATLCDQRSETTEFFGVVNTVVVRPDGSLEGHNTDGLGWSRAVRESFGREVSDLRLLVLGAGGAARAIALQAALEGAPQIVVANRNLARAEQLVCDLKTKSAVRSGESTYQNFRACGLSDAELAALLPEVDLVVNATPAGLTGSSILQARLLRPSLLVFDTLYGSASLTLRREAEAAGAPFCDGLGMLLHQGAAACTLWTGQPAPLEAMRQALAQAAKLSASP